MVARKLVIQDPNLQPASATQEHIELSQITMAYRDRFSDKLIVWRGI